jgi:hypothetical protein
MIRTLSREREVPSVLVGALGIVTVGDLMYVQHEER